LAADLILQKGDKSIVIELKRPSREARLTSQRAIHQVASYLGASGLTDGIVYIPPFEKNQKVEVSSHTIETGSGKFNISVVRT
jgi:hypothetical protein